MVFDWTIRPWRSNQKLLPCAKKTSENQAIFKLANLELALPIKNNNKNHF
jgi:hypothetical protein